MSRVVFPAFCKPVTRDLEEDELEKRLKVLSTHLKYWPTSEILGHEMYESLARHLAKPFFLSHPNKTIQLHIASCLSDILRTFSPTSPYSDAPHILLKVLTFLTDQLKLLQDTASPSYMKSVYILSSLTRANAFALCSNLPGLPSTHKILQSLLTVLFNIINTNLDKDLHFLILTLISDLLNSSEQILEQSLPIIFVQLTNAQETNKNAHNLSKKVLLNCKKMLQPFLTKSLLTIFTDPRTSDLSLEISLIISAISSIFPKILEEIHPQLQTLLNSPDYEARCEAVRICSILLSDNQLNLLQSNRNYWKLFLLAFMDRDKRVRVVCIEKAKFFLENFSTRDDITHLFKILQHDRSSSVRIEVISTIISSAKEYFELLTDNKDLFNIIKERSVDKDFRVRRSTLKHLAELHRERCANDGDSETTRHILNIILCGYYIKEEQDRIWIEKLLITWLVRFRHEVEDRIKRLYLIFAQCDEHASRAFTELHIHRHTIRKCLSKLFESKQQLSRETCRLQKAETADEFDVNQSCQIEGKKKQIEELEKFTQKQLTLVSTFFMDSNEMELCLQKLFHDIDESTVLREAMKRFLQPKISCKQSGDATNIILGEIGDVDKTDIYYTSIKSLLERSSSVVIDGMALRRLIDYLQDLVNGDEISIVGLHPDTAVEQGFKLLEILSFVFAPHFTHPEIVSVLVNFLTMPNASITIKVINIFMHIGKIQHLEDICSTTWIDLLATCKMFIVLGTRKQAKAAVKLIAGLSVNKAEEIINELLERIEVELLNPLSKDLRTSIASLGYISWFCGHLNLEIHPLVTFVYEHFLKPDLEESRGNARNKTWCEIEALSERTIYRLEAMKCITRWLISYQLHESWITKILSLFITFISTKEDISDLGNVRADERSWLRLQAGSCLLKLCRFARIGNALKPAQFYKLSTLMLDDVYEVRKRFYAKLNIGLTRKCPRECLPIDFMGFYALGGLETDEGLMEGLRRGMMMHIRKRTENSDKLMGCCARLGEEEKEGVRLVKNINPECGVIYAVVILAHWKRFLKSKGDEELRGVQRGLEFVMEHWLEGKSREEKFRYFKQLMRRLRACKDARTPDDDRINSKIRTVCDVATCFLENHVDKSKEGFGEGNEAVFEPVIPQRYLLFDEKVFMESEDDVSMEDLSERLKNMKTKRKKKVDQKINLGRSLNKIFGLNKRTKKRKATQSMMQESSKKRRKRPTRGN